MDSNRNVAVHFFIKIIIIFWKLLSVFVIFKYVKLKYQYDETN